MSRLRHPVRAIREPFGTAGLIVAIVALIAALGGTAFAAAKLNSTQKKEVEKIAKKYAGKPGATGATGPAGSAGLAGKDGAQGKQGPEGKQGIAGSPWTAGGTLPVGSTETGAWGMTSTPTNNNVVPVSFSIPLGAALEGTGCSEVPIGASCHVHYINPAGKEVIFLVATEEIMEVTSAACAGSVTAPKATSGNLCVYAGHNTGLTFSSSILKPSGSGLLLLAPAGADTGGALINVGGSGKEANGTWAVTG